MKKRFISKGHLIDSGILTKILNLIISEGGDYEIIDFKIGKNNLEPSSIELEVKSDDEEIFSRITRELINIGCYEKKHKNAILKEVINNKVAPDDFYSTTNHRTEVFFNNKWLKVEKIRMDGVIVIDGDRAICKKLRDLKKGDKVVCGSDAIRLFPPSRKREADIFGFMTNEVSSERSSHPIIDRIANDLKKIRQKNGKIVVVAGPVVIHTGGRDALAALIKNGYVQGLLGGNAIAVHDLEYSFFGTSLGIDLKTGKPTDQGNRNHLRAINKIYSFGSIENAIKEGALTSGVMYELIKNKIPFSLASSIRDDGPLPETETDLIYAQEHYFKIIQDADIVLMLSTMLHAIGTGNMLPSYVKTICVDINPSVITKLLDRGSNQTIGLVTDVGLFLNTLANKLNIL